MWAGIRSLSRNRGWGRSQLTWVGVGAGVKFWRLLSGWLRFRLWIPCPMAGASALALTRTSYWPPFWCCNFDTSSTSLPLMRIQENVERFLPLLWASISGPGYASGSVWKTLRLRFRAKYASSSNSGSSSLSFVSIAINQSFRSFWSFCQSFCRMLPLVESPVAQFYVKCEDIALSCPSEDLSFMTVKLSKPLI